MATTRLVRFKRVPFADEFDSTMNEIEDLLFHSGNIPPNSYKEGYRDALVFAAQLLNRRLGRYAANKQRKFLAYRKGEENCLTILGTQLRYAIEAWQDRVGHDLMNGATVCGVELWYGCTSSGEASSGKLGHKHGTAVWVAPWFGKTWQHNPRYGMAWQGFLTLAHVEQIAGSNY